MPKLSIPIPTLIIPISPIQQNVSTKLSVRERDVSNNSETKSNDSGFGNGEEMAMKNDVSRFVNFLKIHRKRKFLLNCTYIDVTVILWNIIRESSIIISTFCGDKITYYSYSIFDCTHITSCFFKQ